MHQILNSVAHELIYALENIENIEDVYEGLP